NEKEGGCKIQDIDLGNGFLIGEHYKSNGPTRIYGYFMNYKNNEGQVVSMRITSEDYRSLSEEDKELVYTLVSSIK
ncbi:hypothetical protein OAL67_00890, partial [bacterium]|nr:hypothetical protein [bacterium]